jgi:D-alanyl-D-alanine-carboxypeptidase/D-alanyl-D-alanine-endopeptidase
MKMQRMFHSSVTVGAMVASGVLALAQSSPADGIWLGTLTVGGQSIRAQVHLDKGATGCVFDSVDQKVFGLPCGSVKVAGDAVSFEVPAVQGRWVGTLSGDGKTLTGSWSQGPGSLPLVMTRQAAAIEGPKVEPPKFDAVMAPVSVAELKAVIDKDLAEAMAKGELAPATGGGVTIGVVQHGVRRIWSYGAAKPDSVYEIGSISKTFTATILAQMVEQKKVRFDEPVRELLPAGTVAKPDGAEITLEDLSDQHSGLPRMPDNFHPADKDNPYADYDAKALYEYVGKKGVALPANAPFGYSNLGVGLLGQALSNAAGVPYGTLLEQEVTGPLGMKSTGIALTPEMKARFITGHDGDHHVAHAWDLVALAGAGGIRSDAADMLTYLEAQLHPEKIAAKGDGKTLAAAIAETHVVRKDVGGGTHIALNWFKIDETGSYWHNGGTGGYSSYALFNPAGDYAVVVLFNRTVGEGSITDELGKHVEQRLRGVKAISIP